MPVFLSTENDHRIADFLILLSLSPISTAWKACNYFQSCNFWKHSLSNSQHSCSISPRIGTSFLINTMTRTFRLLQNCDREVVFQTFVARRIQFDCLASTRVFARLLTPVLRDSWTEEMISGLQQNWVEGKSTWASVLQSCRSWLQSIISLPCSGLCFHLV